MNLNLSKSFELQIRVIILIFKTCTDFNTVENFLLLMFQDKIIVLVIYKFTLRFSHLFLNINIDFEIAQQRTF